MAEEIKIVIGADSSDLSAQLAKAEKDLKKFQDTLKKSSDTKEIEALNKKIEETNAIINQLRSAVGKVIITADTTDLDNKVNNSKDKLEQIQSPAPAQITADTTNIDAAVAKADAELQTIETPPPVNITADTTGIDTAVAKVDGELSQIQAPAPVNITADTTNIDAAVAKTDAELQTIETPPPVIINADINDLLTETEKAKTETESLQSPPPVEITADASTFNAELQKAENELRQFQAALKRTTDVKELAGLNQKIVETQKKIEGLNKSFQSIKPSTNAASGAVLNLSRIVQDSAFGFIGIANNIQPFIDSLGYARKEAQATGTSLGKNLLSVLTGAGGLSLAFAAVTTAITFAQIGFSAWTRSTTKVKETTDQLKKSQEDLQKSIDGAKSSALSSGLALQGYVNIAKDSTLPLSQRNEALKQANEILGEHGKKLTLANIATKEITDQTQLYTQALIAQAVASKYTDEIAKLTVERIALENKLAAAQKDIAFTTQDVTELNKKYNKSQKDGIIVTSENLGVVSKNVLAQGRLAESQNKVKTIQEQLTKVTNSISEATTNANKATLEATAAFGKLGYKAKDVKEAFEKIEFKKLNLKLLEFKTAFDKDIQFDIPVKVKFSPTVTEPQAVTDFIKNQYRKEIIDFINRYKDSFIFKIPIGFENLPTDTLKKLFGDLYKQVSDFDNRIKQAGQAVADTINNIGALFGEALGAAFAGKKFDFLGGFVDILSSGLIQVGKILLQIGGLAELVQKALASLFSGPQGPILAIFAGFALITLGSLIKNLKTSKFATGTNFAPGGMALVGERGPELVNLPRGSQVIPAGRTAQMMGGIGNQIEVFGMLRGQDIYFSNKKYGQTYGRTT